MRPVELVVAITDDEHGRYRFYSPPYDPEHVERRLVGPVDVLDDHHRRPCRRQLLEQPVRDRVRLRVAFHELQEAVIAADPREVGERPQRARREQRVAVTAEHAGERPDLLAESTEDDRLPDPRLPGQ